MTFSQRLQRVAQNPEAFKRIGRGLERESLRITPQGKISEQPHPSGLGSAFTNKWITTDFAESLLEFITPVSHSVDELLGQLSDIHKFTYTQLGDEHLWPMSMPCRVENEDKIALAQYGSSNAGRMKNLYRQGLKRRYGSLMQVISGVHFNFSFPTEFWDQLFDEQTPEARQESVSDAYFGLIRNYYRLGWLIPYLFGASPALCRSFVDEQSVKLNFKNIDHDTYYLPTATALRLSDLGYTNHEQNSFRIGFNSLPQYLSGLEQAMQTPSAEFAKIGIKVDGEYRQLNANVLQIENELYAPIRAKRVATSGEKSSEALARGGVEYIEVRSLDVNPFSPVGIDALQVRFLDMFLVWSALSDSAPMTDSELLCWRKNWEIVVMNGRDPNVLLTMGCSGKQLTVQEWGSSLFKDLFAVAEVMDHAFGGNDYRQTCVTLMSWIEDPTLTLSEQLLSKMKAEGGIAKVGEKLAREHADLLKAQGYQCYDQQLFLQEVDNSVMKQLAIEASDQISFDEYLQSYFSQAE